MRLGVLDVGSNSAHLLVVDAHPGARPMPSSTHSVAFPLADSILPDGRVGPDGVQALLAAVRACTEVGDDRGVEELLAFATSALQETVNGTQVLAQVRGQTGVDLQVLGGVREATLTFLAARRWFGWSAGRLVVLDIGNGAFEVAAGTDEVPDVAMSLLLGAGRLTRERLHGDPPSVEQVRAARTHVRASLARVVRSVARLGPADIVVGTSKMFGALARVSAGSPQRDSRSSPRMLRRAALADQIPRLAAMTGNEMAALPGVSPRRARHLVAGALVADAAMDLLGAKQVLICPWALREGLILRRLDVLAASH